ncbi:MAG TPA: alpha-L-fucosidase [Gemmatimonadales bacterium]|nr:alpha-L-fucosidase [Gemmatimonadales bacterium]
MIRRREFVSSVLAAGAVLPVLARGAPVLANRALPTANQLHWADLEVGLFLHFAPNTWQDREYDDRSTPLAAISPDVDTDQWARVARDLGARYVVMVAKHQGGFCMWQTETTEYSIRNTPWKGGRGDVMAEVSASCRKYGLGLGVYCSPRDDHFGSGGGGRCDTPEKQRAYNRLYRRQLTELLTRYGEMVEIWFDGSIVVPVCDIVRMHAPHAAIFQGPCASIRWVGNEDGFAPYPCWNALPRRSAATGEATAKDSDPDGDAWLPNEVDVSIRRPNWFWSATDERNLLTTDQLFEIYYRSVGRGAQLLLNIPPDRTGHIAAADAARAKEFGDEIRRRFGTSLGEAHGQGTEVVLHLAAPTLVDHVEIAEDLRGGERVREYQLSGRSNGAWVSLGGGTAVGHKRIQPVPPTTADAIRFEVTRSAATPRIRRLAAFATGAAPPPTWNDPGPR